MLLVKVKASYSREKNSIFSKCTNTTGESYYEGNCTSNNKNKCRIKCYICKSLQIAKCVLFCPGPDSHGHNTKSGQLL